MSRTTQTFRDVPVNRFLEVQEFADHYSTRTPPHFSFARGGM